MYIGRCWQHRKNKDRKTLPNIAYFYEKPLSKSKILLLDAIPLERRDTNEQSLVLIFTIFVVAISNRNCCHDGLISNYFGAMR